MKYRILLALALLPGLATFAQTHANDDAAGIEYIDLIHCSHTDYGYTDHPIIVEDLQKRFLDIALDAAEATNQAPDNQRFCWTAEALDIVWQWWREASPERRSQLIRLVRDGQIDITALPFNVHPFLDGPLWDQALNWIPEELWKALNPKTAIQDDVNGFSRSAAIHLADKGIRFIWNGINTYWGGAPFPQPSGFWWILPDNRKMLVWQSYPYWYGYNLFTRKDWRKVQAEAANTQFRTPRIDDILPADEAAVREAHGICLEKIKKMRAEGYKYDFITLSITNQWRIDNDGPFPPLVAFVKKWNELKLMPKLRLTTASEAMARIERRVGKDLPSYSGEWPDWWAFGVAASPRDLAAAREASRYVQAARSPVWGGNSSPVISKTQDISRLLCRFCEHTFASNEASSNPYGLFNQGSLAEKSIYAYRPYEEAKWLVAQRLRQLVTNRPGGLYVVNPGDDDYSGWIELDRIAFRDKDYRSVKDPATGKSVPILSGKRMAKFWVDSLKAQSMKVFQLSEDSAASIQPIPAPLITVDADGWPSSVTWAGMAKPLFTGEPGKFLSLESGIGYRIEPEVFELSDPEKRKEALEKSARIIEGMPSGKTSRTETAYTVIFTQDFSHPGLKDGKRILEVYKTEPRVSATIRFNRLSSKTPEIYYVEFPFSDAGSFPETSNGGVPFRPYLDQIPGTCTDFFTIDGWVIYPSEKGSCLWSSRDAALISFSSPQFAAKRATPPAAMSKILAMVYNNMWGENFRDDCPGEMQFRFDLAWKDTKLTPAEASGIVQTYSLPPLIMINPATREDPFTFGRMNEIR